MMLEQINHLERSFADMKSLQVDIVCILRRMMIKIDEITSSSQSPDTEKDNYVGQLYKLFQIKPSVLSYKPVYNFSEDWDASGKELHSVTCKCFFINGKCAETEAASVNKQYAKQQAAQKMLKEVAKIKENIGWKDEADGKHDNHDDDEKDCVEIEPEPDYVNMLATECKNKNSLLQSQPCYEFGGERPADGSINQMHTVKCSVRLTNGQRFQTKGKAYEKDSAKQNAAREMFCIVEALGRQLGLK